MLAMHGAHMKINNMHFLSHLAPFLLEWEMFQTNVLDK